MPLDIHSISNKMFNRIVHNLIIDHYRHSQNANVISNDSVETDMFNNINLADEDNSCYIITISDTGVGYDVNQNNSQNFP